MRQVENFIRGEFVAARDGKRFDKVSPVTGEVIASIAEAGRSDVNEAVLAAKEALQGEWSTFTTNQRVEMLYEVADEITRRFEDFVEAEMADTGQPSNVMRHVFIPRGAANFKIFADTIKNVPTESFMLDTPDGAGALNYGVRTPKGVIGVISPWNAPFMLMTWKVGPALACGNTVVVKPSEETPLTSVLLGEVMNKVGVPKGVYNVVNGFGPDSAGAFLTEHKDVDAITFTGETRTGTAIMKAAAEGTRDVSFEMGGKNAGIVFADCDFDKAIEGISRSSFLNSGQVCLGTERVYVERPIFDKFVAALKEKAEAVNYGKPTDEGVNYGPLISKEHQDKVLSYYKKAVEEGATVITGGGVPEVPEALKNGHWIQPTIWTDLADDAAVVKEEIFGPCCHIRPFDSEEEVIGLANSTDYGLATTIWTKDLPRAHRMAAKIDVGICWVNSWFLRDLRTAFGGTKQSGIGREGGVHSLEFYTELRNVCVKL
ncbi:MAG: 2-hydroxymuconic semialdehyde dehydrogenase [Pseudomonadota bacterium]|uniref:2-hydroxymuconic semialdehyde dehydrogenase n=1 Tax=Alteromonas alba TaxID=2079529 RepID=A0A2S9V6P5_9ALTE|nr:2-hydroxymuconic semialdehyde dehydrogenase [Alteromonas alba]MDY6929077.1 2-hydroxymuconic semialdehyde dehydrogenase [Pseudomonadota bacterium]PRO72025.1 2-hydroxymuconic semialdehyde dehydrogenase [Alteromonas alba]|tara:strand:+ start:4162 stop:5622 length:1461 start_codon:yes stop_codon:yes gene_type:complete